MCGISGVVGDNLFKPAMNSFRTLLFLSSFRGVDSTGMVVWDKKMAEARTRIHKEVRPAHEVAWDSRTETWLEEGYDRRCFMGHARAATKGDKTEANAHPFEFENIIGMHNGTVHGPIPHKDEYGTDSEAIFRLINDKGIVEALNIIEEKSVGDPAYCLTWIDKKKNTFHAIRNDKRPFVFLKSKDEKTIYYSSQGNMLKFMHSQVGHQVEDQVYFIKPHDMITIDLTNLNGAKECVFEEVKVEKKRVFYSAAERSATVFGGRNSEYVGGYRGHGYAHHRSTATTLERNWDGLDDWTEEDVKKLVETNEKKNKPKKGGKTNKQKAAEIVNLREIHDKKVKDLLEASKSIQDNAACCDLNERVTEEHKEVAKPQRYGFRAEPLHEAKYLNLIHQGCCNCGGIQTEADYGNEEFIDRDNYLCSDCNSNPPDWIIAWKDEVDKQEIHRKVAEGEKLLKANPDLRMIMQ